ncbi:MAG: lysophospholipid acyltransferase family protein [Pseudomonadota bacterium]
MAPEPFVASVLCGFARLLTGVRAVWLGCVPENQPRIYFANHSSHGDFLLIWSVLPPDLRWRTRPVAAADYWQRDALRRYLAQRVFRAVLVDRVVKHFHASPLEAMDQALHAGDSLILFPEGTRNPERGLLTFKSGLYHLAKAHPGVELVPVWIENLGRAMPKGSLIPVPLLCSLTFGSPLTFERGEGKETLLSRARKALLALEPPGD